MRSVSSVANRLALSLVFTLAFSASSVGNDLFFAFLIFSSDHRTLYTCVTINHMNERPSARSLATLICSILLLFTGLPPASEAAGISIGEQFSGESMDYEVAFWIFNPFGSGRAVLRDVGNGRYYFTHQAAALGFVGVITGYREEIHRSLMTMTAGGKKFIPLRYEHESVIGDWFRKKTTVYDYRSGKMLVTSEKSGEPISHTEVEIPRGPLYDNPVTAFYNFRFGVYGKVEPGREVYIRLSPKPRDLLHLFVATAEETEKRRLAETEKEGKDLFLTIRLDKEIIGSRELQIWLNKDLVPVSGVVKGIRLLGDITGTLKHRDFSGSSERAKIPNNSGIGSRQAYRTSARNGAIAP